MSNDPKTLLYGVRNNFFRDSPATTMTSSQTETQLLSELSLFQKTRETVLVFGGRDPHKQTLGERYTGCDVFRYHTENNFWECVSKIPEPRHHHCTEFFQGKIWLVGKTEQHKKT